MKQEDKELLLRDLCSRLPYGVILNCCDSIGEKLTAIDEKGLVNYDYDIEEVKPYLFPLSSMTEEEMKELLEISNFNSDIDKICDDFIIFIERTLIDIVDIVNFISYLNAHHFDYRGLIEKGLAINATGLNIY